MKRLLRFPLKALYWIVWFYLTATLLICTIPALVLAAAYELSRSRRERIMYERL